ncbi:GNAT family N-acetyltransferase [Ruminococcus sp. Marseille-P6503]|uniref:GNAT family N-acetyltransferase n=1 Tax=Ruminococcus sp. Marseille-P6503 TaxID=2364796 RepID=UPI000F5317E0|nr:GNAT family N-acetyltransferase [Ruminococcus sp. Marseille-P6503]
MDFLTLTNSYYSEWLGQENILNEDFSGVRYVYSEERNRVQTGYPKAFDLYVFCQQNRAVISYGDKMLDKIEICKAKIKSSIPICDLKEILFQIFGTAAGHNVKYVFGKPISKEFVSKPLVMTQYEEYLNFFKKNNPECRNTDWLKDYFADMVDRNLCCGYFINGELVSCTDVPDMPYMAQTVQEIGVNTLSGFRGKGYAADVCTSCIKSIIQSKKCPLWSTKAENIASQKLAEKIGFIKLADVLVL